MSRVEEICVRHKPMNHEYNEVLIVNNIQDINKTLAMIYDFMVSSSRQDHKEEVENEVLQ